MSAEIKTDHCIYIGHELKALPDGRVGGYLVTFSDASTPDLTGEYFTKNTYFGPRDGDGADALFNHGMPLTKGMDAFTDHLFKPIATKKDEVGIWAEVVLDLSDQYEAKVHELAAAGKLGWSSGSAGHMVRKNADGEITRWPIAEGSLTPIPAEPRSRVDSIKSINDFSPVADVKASIAEVSTVRELEEHLRDVGGYSQSASKALIAKFADICQRDAGDSLKSENAALRAQLVTKAATPLSDLSILLKRGIKND